MYEGMGLLKDIFTLIKVLDELKPYVIVVGSFARGDNHSGSDIDLYIKMKPEDSYDCETEEDTYITEVKDIFDKYEIEWDSCFPCTINSTNLPIMLDTSAFFNLKENARIHKVNILGIELDATVDTYEIH
jgi:hypothetical protein